MGLPRSQLFQDKEPEDKELAPSTLAIAGHFHAVLQPRSTHQNGTVCQPVVGGAVPSSGGVCSLYRFCECRRANQGYHQDENAYRRSSRRRWVQPCSRGAVPASATFCAKTRTVSHVMYAGTRWRETRMIFGSAATEEMGIGAFDQDRSYTVVSENCGCTYRTTFTFEADGTTATNVQMLMDITPNTLCARAMRYEAAGGRMAGETYRFHARKKLSRPRRLPRHAIQGSSGECHLTESCPASHYAPISPACYATTRPTPRPRLSTQRGPGIVYERNHGEDARC